MRLAGVAGWGRDGRCRETPHQSRGKSKAPQCRSQGSKHAWITCTSGGIRVFDPTNTTFAMPTTLSLSRIHVNSTDTQSPFHVASYLNPLQRLYNIPLLSLYLIPTTLSIYANAKQVLMGNTQREMLHLLLSTLFIISFPVISHWLFCKKEEKNSVMNLYLLCLILELICVGKTHLSVWDKSQVNSIWDFMECTYIVFFAFTSPKVISRCVVKINFSRLLGFLEIFISFAHSMWNLEIDFIAFCSSAPIKDLETSSECGKITGLNRWVMKSTNGTFNVQLESFCKKKESAQSTIFTVRK